MAWATDQAAAAPRTARAIALATIAVAVDQEKIRDRPASGSTR